MASLASKLLDWFEEYGRTFPFRWQRDAYRILVAGILLRQTRAAQVADVFPTFIIKYSTLKLLANADEYELRALLAPLGITSRVRTLIKIARILIIEHDGAVPKSYDELIQLPGVGDYIASCIVALCYKQSVPMIDVNVERIFRRICGANVDVRQAYSDTSPKNAREAFHYAVLDLGQLVCRHSRPKCYLCPVRDSCEYFGDLHDQGISTILDGGSS